MQERKASKHNTLPAGTIVLYAGSTVPDGWLQCDGTARETEDSRYADLFIAIGRRWNRKSDNDNVFRVPELGEFSLPQTTAAWAVGHIGNGFEDDVLGSITYLIKT